MVELSGQVTLRWPAVVERTLIQAAKVLTVKLNAPLRGGARVDILRDFVCNKF